MSDGKKIVQPQENNSGKKSAEEPVAGQKAAERLRKKKHTFIICVVAAGLIIIVVLFFMWGSDLDSGAVEAEMSDGIQIVTTNSGGGGSGNITVKAGTQVEWTINASSNLGCMGGFQANSGLGISRTTLRAGQANTVIFTPEKEGKYTLRCLSMGMTYCTVNVT